MAPVGYSAFRLAHAAPPPRRGSAQALLASLYVPMTGVHLLFGGFGAGLAMAAPVGPVAALCISVTLRRGAIHGIVAGLGAALADALFAAVAVYGFAGASGLLQGREAWIHLLAGAVLTWVAWRRFRRPAALHTAEQSRESGRNFQRSFLGPLLLTLGNPATILSFAAVLGALGLHGVDLTAKASALVTTGVFCGAMVWWGLVTWVADRLRDRSRPATLLRFERIVTTLLFVFGAGLGLFGLWSLLAAIL